MWHDVLFVLWCTHHNRNNISYIICVYICIYIESESMCKRTFGGLLGANESSCWCPSAASPCGAAGRLCAGTPCGTVRRRTACSRCACASAWSGWSFGWTLFRTLGTCEVFRLREMGRDTKQIGLVTCWRWRYEFTVSQIYCLVW